jgi:hypothetical protein
MTVPGSSSMGFPSSSSSATEGLQRPTTGTQMVVTDRPASSSSAISGLHSAVTQMAISSGPNQHPNFLQSPACEFVRFKRLPRELKVMIWKWALLSDGQVIEMIHPDHYRSLSSKIKLEKCEQLAERYKNNRSRTIDHGNILHACSLSYNTLKKFLVPLQIGGKQTIGETLDEYTGKQTVFFYPEVDTIYFGPLSNISKERGFRWEQDHISTKDRPTLPLQWRGPRPNTLCVNCRHISQCRTFHHYLDPCMALSDYRNFHPLLVDHELMDEREKLVNVAFDIDIWDQTDNAQPRKSRGTKIINFFAQFPSATRFIQTLGDTREDGSKTDLGFNNPPKLWATPHQFAL